MHFPSKHSSDRRGFEEALRRALRSRVVNFMRKWERKEDGDRKEQVVVARYDSDIGIISRIKINSEATLICLYNAFFLAFYCLLFLLCCMNNGTDISQSGLPPERNGLHDSWSSSHLVLFCPK